MPYGFKKIKLGELALKEMAENTLPYDQIPKWMQEHFLIFSHEDENSVEDLGNGVYRLNMKYLDEKYGI